MLAIEVDGSSHNDKYEQDKIRQQELENIGVRFLRFNDLEVKKDMCNVLRVIENWIQTEVSKNGYFGREEPTPNPSEEGNRKQ